MYIYVACHKTSPSSVGCRTTVTGRHVDFEQTCGNPTVGCRMSESPNPHNSTHLSRIPQYGNSALSNNLLYQNFWSIIWIQTSLTKKRMTFYKAGLYPIYLTSSKQRNWYHWILLNAIFSVLVIQGFWSINLDTHLIWQTNE